MSTDARTDGVSPPSTLRVDLAGEVVDLASGSELTFGRIADLHVDDNPHLHRVVGAFRWIDDAWWIVNLGSTIVLELVDLQTTSRISVAPGGGVPLTFATSVVRFQAGRFSYQLDLEQASEGGPLAVVWERPEQGDQTVTASHVPLNDEQRLLLAGLAQFRLADRAAPRSELATNRAVADALGWSTTKFNRKLDYLCERFSNLGVAGLAAVAGGSAWQRRERLVDHVLVVGLIGVDDLLAYQRATEDGGQVD